MKRFLVNTILCMLLLTSPGLAQVVSVDSVATIAALRGLSASRAPGAMIYVQAYSTAGSWGGGQFIWNPSSSAADDGCTVIKPSSVSGAGRFIFQAPSTGVLSALQCGADPTGTNDSGAAINAAATALPAGGIVMLPGANPNNLSPANYKITVPIVISNPGITLQGAGTTSTATNSATTLECATGATNCVTFTTGAASGGWIKSMSILGTGMSGSSFLIAFDGTTSGSAIYNSGMDTIYCANAPNGIYLRNINTHTERNVRCGTFTGNEALFMDGRDGTTAVQVVDFYSCDFSPKISQGATSVGTVSGTTFTAATVSNGTFQLGQTLRWTGSNVGTNIAPTIIAFNTGTGGAGTYTISNPSNLSASSVAIWSSVTPVDSIVMDGWTNSVHFVSTGLNYGGRYAVWTKNTNSAPSIPSFIYFTNDGTEDGYGASFKFDVVDLVWISNAYLKNTGEDPIIDVASGTSGQISIGDSTVRASGRDGGRFAGSSLISTGTQWVNNGTYDSSAYQQNVSAVSSYTGGAYTGVCEISWTSALAPTTYWTPRTGDIVQVSGITGLSGSTCNQTGQIAVIDNGDFILINSVYGTGTAAGTGVVQLKPSNLRLMNGLVQASIGAGRAGLSNDGINRAEWGITADPGVVNVLASGVLMLGNQTAAIANNSGSATVQFPNGLSSASDTTVGPSGNFFVMIPGSFSTGTSNFANGTVLPSGKIAIVAATCLISGGSATTRFVVAGVAVTGSNTCTTTATTTVLSSPAIVDATGGPVTIGLNIASASGASNLSVQYSYKVIQ